MSFNSMTDVIGGVIIVALVTTIVAHRQSAAIIKSAGDSSIGLLRTAMGQNSRGGY